MLFLIGYSAKDDFDKEKYIHYWISIILSFALSIGMAFLIVKGIDGHKKEIENMKRIAIEQGYAKQVIIDKIKGETDFTWIINKGGHNE